MTAKLSSDGPRLRRALWSVLVAVLCVLTACSAQPPDRRADAEQLSAQIRAMPGVQSTAAEVADRAAEGRVYVWLTVEVDPGATAEQVAAVTDRYLQGLRSVDYSGYQTELVIAAGTSRFTLDAGARPDAADDQIVRQVRDWVVLRRELPGSTVELRAVTPVVGSIVLPEQAGHAAVGAAVTTLAERFPPLSNGAWTLSAGKSRPSMVVTAQRLPTPTELAVWDALDADQRIPHGTALLINAPKTPPVWISQQTLSRDPGAAVELATRQLPTVATLPTPVLYTAGEQLQGHRNYYGQVLRPVAVTVGGCTARNYRPDAAEQALIDRYENCRR